MERKELEDIVAKLEKEIANATEQLNSAQEQYHAVNREMQRLQDLVIALGSERAMVARMIERRFRDADEPAA